MLRRWTRVIADVGNLRYEDRFSSLGLFSVHGRLLRTDLIKIWRVMKADMVGELMELLTVAPDLRARGHRY